MRVCVCGLVVEMRNGNGRATCHGANDDENTGGWRGAPPFIYEYMRRAVFRPNRTELEIKGLGRSFSTTIRTPERSPSTTYLFFIFLLFFGGSRVTTKNLLSSRPPPPPDRAATRHPPSGPPHLRRASSTTQSSRAPCSTTTITAAAAAASFLFSVKGGFRRVKSRRFKPGVKRGCGGGGGGGGETTKVRF